ncbi:MAG TPA: MlaD family protein [Candidatus Binatia bacterium]|nr:MlaD family protein [Candidatus Binatia bacterium]
MSKLSYFKIGLFTIGAIVIAVTGVIVLGVGTVFQRSALVETYIEESVQGLDIGSPMKFRGVQVGKVEEITLTSAVYDTRRRYVLVRIDITSNLFEFPLADPEDPIFRSELERGFRVRLAAQGLTGVAYLEADYLDPERNPPLEIDWQPRYPYIPSARSRIVQLSDSVESILQNFEQLDIPRLMTSVDRSLAAITKMAEGANVEKVGVQAYALLTEVRETNRQLKDLVGSPELKSVVADAAAATAGARQIIERAEKPLNQMLDDLPRAAESLERLAKRLDAVSADLPDTSSQLRQTVQRLNRLISGQQQDIEKTVDNLRSISENLKELTDDSRKYPAQVFFGAPPPPSKVMQR